MNDPWIICGAGALFCIAGIYYFYRNIYEEQASLQKPVILLIAGVVLITWGSAKLMGLIQ
ncbi:MAG TPA: hypothetical protein VFO70_05340 [Chitinophagaceae bacterium]|nr:hypothetical protein [Chitinophagaceae bacterium]